MASRRKKQGGECSVIWTRDKDKDGQEQKW